MSTTMSETSAGHDTATTAGRTTTAAGTGGSPQLSAMQELAIEYKTSIAASIGGAAGALIGFPLDSIKTRLQGYKFHSVADCVTDTYKNEGMGGFFRGMSIPLITITIVRTTSFTVYEMSRRFYGRLLGHPLYCPPPRDPRKYAHYVTTPPYSGFFGLNASTAFLSGLVAGTFISCLACPFEFTKIATQTELIMKRRLMPADEYVYMEARSPMQMARDIYAGRGIRGFYGGFPWHLARDGFGTGIYFAAYESSKYMLSDYTLGAWTYAISGAICGIVSWMVIFPLDTAKTVVQRDILMHEPGVYYRPKRLWSFNWASKRMYRGMAVSIVRSGLVNAINFSLYEGVKRKITAWEPDSIGR